jgi:hypothetical protein
MDRLKGSLTERGLYDFALAEVLLWIASLYKLDERTLVRKSTEDVDRLKALVWARNYIAHGLLAVSNPPSVGGGYGTSAYATVGYGMGPVIPATWIDASHLPVPSQSEKQHFRADEVRRPMYVHLIQGKPVLEPLVDVETYLASRP